MDALFILRRTPVSASVTVTVMRLTGDTVIDTMILTALVRVFTALTYSGRAFTAVGDGADMAGADMVGEDMIGEDMIGADMAGEAMVGGDVVGIEAEVMPVPGRIAVSRPFVLEKKLEEGI